MAGAMASSVWNSMTRSTVLADELFGDAERDLRLVAVADDDQLDVLALAACSRPRVHSSRLGETSCSWPLRAIPDADNRARTRGARETTRGNGSRRPSPAAPVMKRVQQAEAQALAEAVRCTTSRSLSTSPGDAKTPRICAACTTDLTM